MGRCGKCVVLNYSGLRMVYMCVECFGEDVDVVIRHCCAYVVALAATRVAVAIYCVFEAVIVCDSKGSS